MEMKVHVIVAGSRKFQDYEYLEKVLNKLLADFKNENEITIITGAANGADRLGSEFAINNGYELKEFPADWSKYGNVAGFVRNKQMIDYLITTDGNKMLVAFWNGKSSGTRDIISLARRKGVNVSVVPIL